MRESLIHVQDVTVMREGKPLLADISWQMQSGEHWALLGANGAGKTTLLQTVLGYLWPTRGHVQVLGHTLGEYDVRELRKEIGFVSANMDARLSPGESALGIVLTGLSASYELYEEPSLQAHDRARALLAQMGLEERAQQAYHTLSQGERQKVLIARALMPAPRLLILDEPCSGLDFPSRERLLAAIDEVIARPDAPHLLYVTHYPDELTPAVTHALLLANGVVVASGDKTAVLAREPLTSAFGVPVQVTWQDGYPLVRMARS